MLKKEEIISAINGIDYITKEEYISNDLKGLDANICFKEFLFISFFLILIVFLMNRVFGVNIFNVISTIDSSITYGMLFIIRFLTSIH